VLLGGSTRLDGRESAGGDQLWGGSKPSQDSEVAIQIFLQCFISLYLSTASEVAGIKWTHVFSKASE